jgi:diguanylate cyclase (GGDEF)-like protein
VSIADKHGAPSLAEEAAPARFSFATEGEFEWMRSEDEPGRFDQKYVAALVVLRWLICATYVALGATGTVPMHPLALLGSGGWIAMTNVLSTWHWAQKRPIAWYDNAYLYLDFLSVFFGMLATANLGYPIWAALVMLMIQAPAEQPARRATFYNAMCVATYPVCGLILEAAGWYNVDIGVAITATAILMFIALNLSITFEGNRRLRRMIRGMAITDALTGLPNRRELSRHLASPPTDGTRIGVIVMDVDRFKQYNDSYGHLAGDQLLVRLAECIRESFPQAETIARYGGDEFVIVTEVTDPEVLARRVEAMQDRCVARAAPVSAGIAIWPDHQPTLDSALAAADDALRETKRQQRGRSATYDAAGLIHVRTS